MKRVCIIIIGLWYLGGGGGGGGAGGECAPSHVECERMYYLFLEDSLLANSPTIFISEIMSILCIE